MKYKDQLTPDEINTLLVSLYHFEAELKLGSRLTDSLKNKLDIISNKLISQKDREVLGHVD